MKLRIDVLIMGIIIFVGIAFEGASFAQGEEGQVPGSEQPATAEAPGVDLGGALSGLSMAESGPTEETAPVVPEPVAAPEPAQPAATEPVIAETEVPVVTEAAPSVATEAAPEASPAEIPAEIPPAASGEKIAEWVWGEVVSVDEANKQLVIKHLDYETYEEVQTTLSLGEKTLLENAAGLGEVKPGDYVTVDYTKEGANNIAGLIVVEKKESMAVPAQQAVEPPTAAPPVVEPPTVAPPGPEPQASEPAVVEVPAAEAPATAEPPATEAPAAAVVQ